MGNAYPYSVLKDKTDIDRQFTVINTAADDISEIFRAIIAEVLGNGNSTVIVALAKAGCSHVVLMEDASTAINEYCFAGYMAYEAFEDANAALLNRSSGS
ncbi:MAG: hypothetical protein KJ585_04845 [Alphaproteobacteria bacterium]|nr:hypothetical protein [Alphaproteobacteria bacterium]